MSTFSLHTEIHFGNGSLEELRAYATDRVLLVTDEFLATTGLFAQVLHYLGPDTTVFKEVVPNPTVSLIAKGVACYLSVEPAVVIALGGGSSIDAAKAMHKAALDSGFGAPLGLVVVPTTSGSGSEVTSFAVVTDEATHAKLPMISRDMLPGVAILDPQCVVGVPPKVTADSGMDVLTHAVEAYVSTAASDFSDACAEKSVHLLCANLQRCYDEGTDLSARERMHNASTLAAMAFNNSNLGINHSLAHALGGHFPVAHGRLNAMLMPHVMAYNADRSDRAATKYAWLAHLVGKSTGPNVKAGVLSFISAIEKLNKALGIHPRLADEGIDPSEARAKLDEMAEQALADGCTPTNPVAPTHQDLVTILRQLL